MNKLFKKTFFTTSILLGTSIASGYAMFNFALKRKKEEEIDIFELADKFVEVPNGLKGKKKEEYDKKIRKMNIIRELKPWFIKQPYETAQITSFDGLHLKARIMLSEKKSNKYVIAIHGYRSHGVREYLGYIKYYLDHGINVIIPDDRSHGNSEGKYIGMGYLDQFDCRKWIDYAILAFGEDIKIMLHGISMGAATVMMTSGKTLPKQVKCIVEDCGYTSVKDEFTYNLKTMFPIKLPKFPIFYVAQWFCKQKAGYNFSEAAPVKEVAKTKLPMLFIHGDKDDFVPTHMVYRLYNICKSEKKLLIIPDAGHTESHIVNPEVYEKTVLEFADKYLV